MIKKGKLGIEIFSLIEMLIGIVTLTAIASSLILGTSTKSIEIIIFVLTTAGLSAILGFGILKRDLNCYNLLLYFSSVIILSKILIFAKIITLNGALETTIPSPLKNIISILYHSLLIFYFTRNSTKQEFGGRRDLSFSLKIPLKINKHNKYQILDILLYAMGLIAAVGLFMFIHLKMIRELEDPDIWLHLKTGQYIVEHKCVPQAGIYSNVPNKEWIDHSWLVQVIFYLVFHFGGVDNLILLSSILITTAFLFLFFSGYGERKHLIFTLAILFITILASRIRFNIRPENFSILFFSIYLFILTKLIRSKWMFLLPLIQLIWTNMHGFFILGPFILLIFILAEKIKRTDLLPWEWSKVERLDKKSYKYLISVFGLACLVSFINPYSYKLVFYPFRVILTSIGRSSIFYKYIVELLPTWHHAHLLSPYFLLIILSAFAFFLNPKKINIAYLMFWLISLLASLSVNRNVIFFNFIAFLTINDNLANSLFIKKLDSLDNYFKKMIYLLKFTLTGILIFWTLTNNNSILRSRYYIFDEGRTKSYLLGITARKLYPSKAADFILEKRLPGNIFNLFSYGSYLIYRLAPRNNVFIDGRTELYGDEYFRIYMSIENTDKEAIAKVFNQYHINIVLLSGAPSDIGNLSNYFYYSPEWALVYFDPESLIFLKNTPRNKTFISKLKIDLKKWKTQKADLYKIGFFNEAFPEPYLNRSWIFLYLDLYEQALNEAKEAIRILPDAVDPYNIMARIYLKQKLYDQAFESLRIASVFNRLNQETLISLGNYYTEKDKYNDAVKVYKDLVKSYPYGSMGHYLLAQSLIEINDSKSAIKALREALKINPLHVDYYKALGELLYKNSDLEGAARVYKSAIEKGLNKADFYKSLDAIYNKVGVKK